MIFPLSFLLVGAAFASALPDPTSVLNDLDCESGSDLVAASWYAGWHSADVPLSGVSWEKYTHMTYAFAETTPDPHKLSLANSDEQLLPEFVKSAHEHGVKALVSIGGWTGGLYFSSNVGDATNRTIFVNTVIDMVTTYGLDGIDIDWEYPNKLGVGCNVVSPSDTANLLFFLQELRAHPLGSTLIVTAASSISPWVDENGNASTDLSGFASVLTYVAVMNYDIWGSWSNAVGPNAPLDDACASPANQAGSATSAVQAWNAAGIPHDQIVLGVPGYGHSFRVSTAAALPNGADGALASYPAFNKADQPLGDRWDDANPGPDVCGNAQGAGGVFNFFGLVEGGFLNDNGTVAAGIAYAFDECSQTPFVYNSTSQVMVSYDNADSFAAKGKFINTLGLRGFAMWEAGGDFKDILVDSIRSASGFA
ncbi:glycoside hydrolase family 18 protein [Heterobasidion irregulare TC 32-1]|uniref:Glycoside hydrolase family 18 protein n=1 Tax=Heterobasidion irregulare (strain TC 32-1) TaxID=747525 RepID=W4K5R2_HETIT|nr:glycoside hydrolase family 18 protein [Heterobasidion irregulare TC 32-1]ETW81104.1 glycoside hydrolase family 18 protein [Heterobasidion irregulare TC 32-1]